MGRRSYEDHEGAIPKRLNIVATRNQNLKVSPDIRIANNLKACVDLAAEVSQSYFVIGGSGLIVEALPQASVVFETVVDADIDGDTFLPVLDFSDWSTDVVAEHAVDKTHTYAYTIYRHARR